MNDEFKPIEKMLKTNLEKSLKKIKDIMGEDVLITVGVVQNGELGILRVEMVPKSDAELFKLDDPNYIG